jgi:GMP synthase-like glutamine amidotransferase
VLKRLHYIQHVPFEDLANIETWAKAKDVTISVTKLYKNEPLPKIDDFDLLCVMGGPMNIYEEDVHPWLKDEKALIHNAILHNKKVLGVCLGAQLIADALGAKVVQNKQKEIGWHKVTAVTGDDYFPEEFIGFQWHGDIFDIPKGATLLASSSACANQAFRYQDNVLALQFHLEYTGESIGKMLQHCGEELLEQSDYIQSIQEIRAGYDYLDETKRLLNKVLENLISN